MIKYAQVTWDSMLVFLFNFLNWIVLQPLVMTLFLMSDFECGKYLPVHEALGYVMLFAGWAFALLFLLLYGWSAACIWKMKQMACRNPWFMSVLMVLPYTGLLLSMKGCPAFLVIGWVVNGACCSVMSWVWVSRERRNAGRKQ